MIPVLSSAEAARLDASSPVPVSELMERAGLGVALAAVELGASYGKRVDVLVGPGNNGGDGYVAARYLRTRGVGVVVRQLADPRTDAARAAARAAVAAGVPVRPLGPPGATDIVVDAVFGGGFRHDIPDSLAAWFGVSAPVVAVDVPTGLDPDTGEAPAGAFRAAVTVTFHAPKTGHFLGEGPDRCGRLRVVDIGLTGGDPVMRLVEDGDVVRPSRARRAHKWSAGSVLVVGGAPGMSGAAVMAARAALHFGAGAAGVAVPEASLGVVSTQAPELLTYDISAVDSVRRRFDVLLVGPGLGGAGLLVGGLLESHTGPVVLDADGINAIDSETLRTREAATVLTPHAGEFSRLTGEAPGPEPARRLAAATGSVVLLKGNPTFVTDGSPPWAIVSNGPELATIGTGDVLAGMVAALIARGADPLPASYSAAHLHGRAGADLGAMGTVTADTLATAIGRYAWEGER